jgi:hypothetical protein
MRSPISVAVLAVIAVLAAAARADVLVVAPSGGDFTQISSAIAAADEGDLVLVHPAPVAYGPFSILGKSLTVVAAHAGDAVKTRAIGVLNLSASQVVVLRGFTVSATLADHAPGVLVDDCDGAVRLEKLTVTGSPAPFQSSGQPATFGVEVFQSQDVGLVDCVVVGGAGASSDDNDWSATSGTHGLQVWQSSVWVHGSHFTGGQGGSHFDPDVKPGEFAGVGNGGAGIAVQNLATLSLAASSATGGAGGVQIIGLTLSDGGDGLLITGSDSVVHQRASGFMGAVGTGRDGMPIDQQAGFLETITTAPRTLSVPSPVREGEAVTFSVTGHASDVAFLLAALAPRGGWVPALQGPVLVAAPLTGGLLPLGTVPPTGPLTVAHLLPDFGPGFEFLDVHVQLLIESDDGTTLENGSTITVLSAAF